MNPYEYEKLLDRAWEKLPDKLKNHSRFEIPKADSFVEGNQTIIRNFNEIANILGRDPKHLLTYLSKELAAFATFDGRRAIINRVLRREMINRRIEAYAKEYVICHECGRPDTKFTELAGEKIVKCEACGGWWPLRKIK
ncbi:MAG TPA: translation initiation factor IF-2 subunit beta [Candidatus Altiarchaeales archaeon]|nr:translation initiation factor IF-2 subunit beta [Candidatus Altiarchaeales archaeon]